MSPDRDRILEQTLKHELRAADMAVTDACLDAETLGAWADDGLDATAMVAAEAHVSNCARCQAMVAVFTRGTAPGTPAPLAPEAPGTVGTAGTLGTLSWWKWLAPLAAGVTAVTLWMVVPEQQQVAVAPPQPAASAPAEAPAAAKSDAPPAAPAAVDQFAERKDKLVVDAREARQRSIDADARKELEAKQENVAAPAREQALADAVVPAAPSPAAPSPAAAARSGAPIAELQKSNRLAFAQQLEIVSPDPARRWRVAGGVIERSEDAGASWTPLRANAGETITAGYAVSGSICWLIGTNGLVLITVDGITFARVPLPEAIDLTSITATDARSATVTTVDGRRFRTDDSGRTWRAF